MGPQLQASTSAIPIGKIKELGLVTTHVCNDSVSIVLGNKVLDLAGWRILQSAASNEVVCDAVLLGVAGLAISNRHSSAIGAVGSRRLRHDGCEFGISNWEWEVLEQDSEEIWEETRQAVGGFQDVMKR